MWMGGRAMIDEQIADNMPPDNSFGRAELELVNSPQSLHLLVHIKATYHDDSSHYLCPTPLGMIVCT